MSKFGLKYLAILLITGYCYSQESPLVLLISFDGFRWNYLDRTSTPNFDKLIGDGVKAKWLQDVFVSQTFPNHYTLATGLYEESHGIVANEFYDPKLNKSFNYESKTDEQSVWWGGEPIWVTNQLQGRNSGVVFWVGSEAAIKGVRPTQWMPYSTDYPWKKRVDMIVNYLANKPIGKDKTLYNITLALLYFPQPDHYGHIYGPESKEVTEMIGQCDSITGYLIDELAANNLYDKVDIIITSDHGMASLSQQRTIPILPNLNLDNVNIIIDYGTGAGIWPKEGFIDSVYMGLKDFSLHAKVWRRKDIPQQFHYTSNDRIPPILIMPDDGWFLVNNTDDPIPMNGSHGYNNSLMDMHPFFIAHGPAFRQGFVSEPFSSVNVYELICHILGLHPAPNNGSLDAVKQLLKSTERERSSAVSTLISAMIGLIIGIVLTVVAIFLIAIHYLTFQSKSVPGYKKLDDTKCHVAP